MNKVAADVALASFQPSMAKMQSAPVLEVEDVWFRRSRDILRGITWKVEAGQHWVVLGANGCGKTTLINVITGYDSASGGSVAVDGKKFGESDWREVRKRVGVVASTLTTLLEPGEPVLDVVASGRDAKLNLIELVPEKLQAKAAKLLGKFGCSHLTRSLWGQLSQGEKQKVLICRALMAKFRLLILDEPCAGLDPVAREVFLQWLEKLASQDDAPPLVMVTHHVEEVLPCMNHAMVLKDGQVIAAGVKRKVLTSANLTTCYGSPVTLTQREGRYRLTVDYLPQ